MTQPSLVKRSLSGHAAIGLLAGALLYIVCLTGTVSVFYPELQRLEQSGVVEMSEVAPAKVQTAVETVFASEAGRPTTHHLYVHLPVDDLPRTTITTDHQAVHLTPDGGIYGPEEIAWSDFLVNLHYTLNLPGLYGLTLVGILGVMILALSISGVVAHPRIFRDAFKLRTRQGGGVGLADWHNRMSVWTLPFAVAIALTGAIIGLASVTAFGMAAVFEDGDTSAVFAPIFGDEAEPDNTPAPVPDVAAALSYMNAQYPDVTPTYVILHDPLTAGQEVQVSALHPRRLIFGEYYRFDASGNLKGTVGMADGALGQQAAASNYNLHFGNYGGLLVKLAYLVFGAALTAICATGIYIWLGKRERRGTPSPRLRTFWNATVIGVPGVLAATFVARLAFGNKLPFAGLFWGGLAAVFCLVWVRMMLAKPALERRQDIPVPG